MQGPSVTEQVEILADYARIKKDLEQTNMVFILLEQSFKA